MVKLIFRLLFPMLLFCIQGHAQPYYFRHYQVENGLSNNTVFCSVQDRHGFMWFGTKDGLNRFDGYRFKTFHINPGDESSLTRDQITCLCLDKMGVLWVGSQKGIFHFDEQKERLVPFIDTLTNIYTIFIDHNGQLWVIANHGFYRYNFEIKELTIFPPDVYFVATSICELEDGSLWFSSSDGKLKKFDVPTRSFKSYDVFAHSPSAGSRWIEKLVPGQDGTIYIGTSGQGLKQFFIAALEYRDLLTYNTDKTTVYVRDILQTSQTEFWFATESGIFILNTTTGKFTNLKKKFLDPYSLS